MLQTHVPGCPQHCPHHSGRQTLPAIVGTPAGSLLRIHSNRESLLHLCRVPAVIIGGLAGKEKRDNSIRIPFSPGTFSTVRGGWLGGCRPALRYYCAWLRLSMTQRRQYSTRRAQGWTVNTKPVFFFFFKSCQFSPDLCPLSQPPLLYKLLKANAHNATTHW